MSVKIITSSQPEVKTYLVPARIREIREFHESAVISVEIPVVEALDSREVTKILFEDGSTVHTFSEVKSERKYAIFSIDERLYEEEGHRLLKNVAMGGGVPKGIEPETVHSFALHSFQVTYTWWEVTW